MPIAERVMILGLDGATWTVLDRMMERGYMPNLKAILAGSAHGVLRSTIPPVTTAAWTTMMTGCDPARHGVFDHRYYDAASGQMRVNHSGRRRVPTMWHTLSDAGRSVISLNLPGTYPPLRVRGIVVSGMGAPHLEAALAGAKDFARRLRAEVPDYTLQYFWKRVPHTLDELVENARATADSFRGRAKGGLLADECQPDWSVLMVQFQNLDPFQHRAWRYLNVDETGVENAPWNDAASLVLRGLDDAVGLLAELAERRNAPLVLVSDHGFGPCSGRIQVNRILLNAGIAKGLSWSSSFGRELRRGYDRWALSKEKSKDPTARSSTFDVSVESQYPFDWKRTLAFAPHQDTAAMVYLNSYFRRPGAPLRTSRQHDEALNQTMMALAEARHPESGKPLFPQVISTADAYGVDPNEAGYPDLIALPDAPYWVRTKLTASKSFVEPDPNLPGTHRPEGIIALQGFDLPVGRMLRADLRDVAPTVLSMIGVPIPAFVEGKPLSEVGESVTTRLDPAGPLYSGPHPVPFEYTPEEEAIIEQRLADLGYLE